VTDIITWSDDARADIRRIPPDQARRINRGIERFARTREGDVKKLADDPLGTWRLRIGDWRVLFTQDRAGLLITRIVNRRDAY